MSVVNRLKALDVYRKVPTDLTEPTVSGAAVSVLSGTFIVLLFFSELLAFLSVTTSSEMFIDVNRGGDKLRVNIDVTMHKLPCSLISLDAQDIMGSHEADIGGSIHKYRLSADGSLIGEEKSEQEGGHGGHGGHGHGHGSAKQPSLDYVRQQIQDREQCQVQGYLLVNKVPGNIHVSTHSMAHILKSVFSSLEAVDVSHTVNHVSFGDEADLKDIRRNFDQHGVLNPLDRVSRNRDPNNHAPVTYEYYLKVVPTTYVTVSKKEMYVYQFTANTNEVSSHNLPALYFRYDMSPVTVKFTQKRESFFHFLVQVSAIIGGVFTVAGIIDSIIHKSVVVLVKKAQLNKLS